MWLEQDAGANVRSAPDYSRHYRMLAEAGFVNVWHALDTFGPRRDVDAADATAIAARAAAGRGAAAVAAPLGLRHLAWVKAATWQGRSLDACADYSRSAAARWGWTDAELRCVPLL